MLIISIVLAIVTRSPFWTTVILVFLSMYLTLIVYGKIFGQPIFSNDASLLDKYEVELDRVPSSEKGIPDHNFMNQFVEFYIQMHKDALSVDDKSSRRDMELAFACRVHAQWGLIFTKNEAIPYAIKLIRSSNSTGKEDGMELLSGRKSNNESFQVILDVFNNEWEEYQTTLPDYFYLETLDTSIYALGCLKNKDAIPALAMVLRSDEVDGDTKWGAPESLETITKKSFMKESDPIQAAINWLDENNN